VEGLKKFDFSINSSIWFEKEGKKKKSKKGKRKGGKVFARYGTDGEAIRRTLNKESKPQRGNYGKKKLNKGYRLKKTRNSWDGERFKWGGREPT